jgi:hypothetical protein
MGYLLVAGGVALFGTVGTWRSWQAVDSVFRTSCRGRVLAGLLALGAAPALAFVFHLGTGFVGWTYLPRGPFDDFVWICIWISHLPLAAVVIGKGGLRVFPALGALGVTWLWVLVAAYSFIM